MMAPSAESADFAARKVCLSFLTGISVRFGYREFRGSLDTSEWLRRARCHVSIICVFTWP